VQRGDVERARHLLAFGHYAVTYPLYAAALATGNATMVALLNLHGDTPPEALPDALGGDVATADGGAGGGGGGETPTTHPRSHLPAAEVVAALGPEAVADGTADAVAGGGGGDGALGAALARRDWDTARHLVEMVGGEVTSGECCGGGGGGLARSSRCSLS
jgi:hypothetical protein